MLRATVSAQCWRHLKPTRRVSSIEPCYRVITGRHKSTNAVKASIINSKTKNGPKYVPALLQDPENKLTPEERRLLDDKPRIKLLIGDYVEVYKKGQYSGIIVEQKRISGRQQRIKVLLRNGKTVDCKTSDVAFYIPDFTSTPEVTRFLREPVTVNRQADKMTFIPTEYMRAVQNYQKTVKLERGRAIRKLDALYAHFSTLQSAQTDKETPKEQSVTLDELTQFAFGLTTPLHRHATFLYLVSDNVHFIPTSDVLQSTGWKLRPKDQVEPISNIIHWVRTKDAVYQGFLQRANVLVDFYRQHADEHTGTMTETDFITIKNKVQLTETDKAFVNFLVDWIRLPKVSTETPHEIFAPAILKGLQCYDDVFVDQSLAITFLKQIGMFHPWDNVGLVEESASIRPFVWSDDAEKYNNIMDTYTEMFVNQGKQQWEKAGFYAQDPCDALRHDFGDLPVYTIDDPSAKEIDDGISVEHIPGTNNEKDKTWLHIHIADPTAYVPPKHTLASIMADRIQTLYLPERHFPMLPESLSSQTFSLGTSAQVVRDGSQYAFTFSAMLDDQGQLSHWKVRPSLVRNVIKLHYDDVDAFLDTQITPMRHMDPRIDLTRTFSHPQSSSSSPPPSTTATRNDIPLSVQKDLLDIYSLAKQHSQQRIRNGAINFMRPNPVISLNPTPLELPRLNFDNGLQYASELPAISLSLDRSAVSSARTMVAEMMMMGGRVVSKYAQEHGIVLPFRTQQWQPEQAKAKEQMLAGRDPVTGMLRFEELLRFVTSLPPAGLTTSPGKPHALMGITDGYCKATSPLRRYMDMIIHWQLKAHLLKEPAPFSKHTLQQVGPRIELREKQMSFLQQRSLQYWVLSLVQRLEFDSDMTWRCIIHEKAHQATTQLGGAMLAAPATILELGIRGRVEHLKDSVNVGDVLNVRVSSINPRVGTVNLVTV